jgi:hypothetical protein
MILSSHCGDYHEGDLLGSNVMLFRGNPTFRKIMSPSSETNSKPSKKPAEESLA